MCSLGGAGWYFSFSLAFFLWSFSITHFKKHIQLLVSLSSSSSTFPPPRHVYVWVWVPCVHRYLYVCGYMCIVGMYKWRPEDNVHCYFSIRPSPFLRKSLICLELTKPTRLLSYGCLRMDMSASWRWDHRPILPHVAFSHGFWRQSSGLCSLKTFGTPNPY